ncbi:UDP-N-acetylmuramoylalanine--D-glutamate ligase [Mycobacterium tuberculosis]|nr:UDP-N-acetylmuramoylalanine--D-glutamate ligase [Mycobacterium tuberculosis]
MAGLDDSRAAALLDGSPAQVRVGFRLGEPAAGELACATPTWSIAPSPTT